MSILPPDDVRGFGKAVRLAAPHSFSSNTTRLQAGDPAYVIERARARVISLILHVVALLAFVLVSGWIGRVLATAMFTPLVSFAQTAELFIAVLSAFLGVFAFMRLAQAAIRALFDVDELMEWPRQDVDWGKQAVVLDRDGIAIATRLARRTYLWDTMAQLTEDDVFVIDRKQGAEIVIPKDPADEDELRDRLMRGISLSRPVARSDR